MKKNYIAPSMEAMPLRNGSLLVPSVTTDGISHGGTDDGTHEADSRRGNGWDSDYE